MTARREDSLIEVSVSGLAWNSALLNIRIDTVWHINSPDHPVGVDCFGVDTRAFNNHASRTNRGYRSCWIGVNALPGSADGRCALGKSGNILQRVDRWPLAVTRHLQGVGHEPLRGVGVALDGRVECLVHIRYTRLSAGFRLFLAAREGQRSGVEEAALVGALGPRARQLCFPIIPGVRRHRRICGHRVNVGGVARSNRLVNGKCSGVTHERALSVSTPGCRVEGDPSTKLQGIRQRVGGRYPRDVLYLNVVANRPSPVHVLFCVEDGLVYRKLRSEMLRGAAVRVFCRAVNRGRCLSTRCDHVLQCHPNSSGVHRDLVGNRRRFTCFQGRYCPPQRLRRRVVANSSRQAGLVEDRVVKDVGKVIDRDVAFEGGFEREVGGG